jgi:hypothetical protein
MLISYNIAEIFAEVLRHSAVKKTETVEFRKYKHNRDLCPRAQRQLTYILDNFVKYYAIAYDVQGLCDQGADVILQIRFPSEKEGTQARCIVLQIKSYEDLEVKDYLTILRAQYQQSLAHYGQSLEHYYVLLCTDELIHLQKIRSVNQAFSTLANITIIDPTYSLAFLRFSVSRIGLIVQDLMREEDIILTKARELISGLTPSQVAILLFLIYHASIDPTLPISTEMILRSSYVGRIYEICPDYDAYSYDLLEERIFYEQNMDQFDPKSFASGKNPFKAKFKDRARHFAVRVTDDLDSMDDASIDMSSSSDFIVVDTSQYSPIQCLIFDTLVRYSYSEDQLLMFIYEVLRIPERYGLRLTEDDPLGG